MSAQYIETPSGDRLAIIPEAEYKSLISLQDAMEDAVDSAAARDMMEKIKSGEEEIIPFEIAERLSSREEHPIRIWRMYREMKAKDLAAAAGVSPVYLSEIENGKKSGSVQALSKIAHALRLTIDDLVRRDVD